MQPKYSIFAAVSLGIIALDQVTKIWVVNHIEYRRGAIDVIDGLFQIVHVQNTGAAFGMGAGTDGAMAVFLGFTAIAAVVLIAILTKLPGDDRLLAAILAMIMGGAVGNAIDRAHKQSVTDFLRFYTEDPTLAPWLRQHFGMSEWPSFNVADIAVVCGVIAFLLHQLIVGDSAGEAEVHELPDEAE